MTDAKEEKMLDNIADLEDRVADLEADLEEALNPPPDWFAQHESYEQLYARLHVGWPDVKGTNPAPWSW